MDDPALQKLREAIAVVIAALLKLEEALPHPVHKPSAEEEQGDTFSDPGY